MDTSNEANRGKRVTTVGEVQKVPGYEWLRPSVARHYIFNARSRWDSKGREIQGNGLHEAGAIIRVGRKLLLDLDALDAWLDSHRDAPHPNDGGEL